MIEKSIKFNKKQFYTLLKSVYLGDWVANAIRINNKRQDYEEIEDYIFSKANEFGYKKYVDHDISFDNHYYPTAAFEDTTDVHEALEEYDDDVFWEELAERLGERDFFEKYTPGEVRKMAQEERIAKMYECIDMCKDKIEQHGIYHLKFVDD